jgi:hypothetical protein
MSKSYTLFSSDVVSKPNSKYREILTQRITFELDSENFIASCKIKSEKKSRTRKLSIKNLIFIILNFKTAIQRELDGFFKSVSNTDFNIREVSKSAFSQARAKLNPYGFQRLNELAVNTFYEESDFIKWHGFRLVSVDGTRLVLPNHASVIEDFGLHKFGPNADSPRSLALASVLYDVLNHISIDGQIDRYDSSERDLLIKHMNKLNKGDLLLLDRGYPCFWLFFLLQAQGIEFCVRMKSSWWIQVNEFLNSDKQEEIVSFELPKKDWDKLAEYPQYRDKKIQCRFIKVVLETGEIEVLCTSLIDTQKYNINEFKELYHYRWNEEETYKLLKCRIEIENFSGKTSNAVKQDFFAKIFLMTLCAAYAHPIEERVIKEYRADQNRLHDQKINRTNALAMTQNVLIAIFIKKQFKKAIK